MYLDRADIICFLPENFVAKLLYKLISIYYDVKYYFVITMHVCEVRTKWSAKINAFITAADPPMLFQLFEQKTVLSLIMQI